MVLRALSFLPVKRLHMLHHYKDCDESFGITTQWVDWLLGTAAAAVQ